jgi:hypothetical protein
MAALLGERAGPPFSYKGFMSTASSNFLNRVLRAAKLDAQLYEEVEADPSAMGQALAVVVLAGLAAGIGTIGHFHGYGRVLGGMLWAIAGWFVWAVLTYWIGTRILPEPQTRADLGEMLRVIGFASAPGLIRVFGVLPGLTGVVFGIASVWMLVAMVIAVRQALDFQSTWRAIGVCAVGWIIQLAVLVVSIRVAAL